MLKDYLLIITNTGRAYWLKAYMVPEEGRYGGRKAAVNLVKFSEGEKAQSIINTQDPSRIHTYIHNGKGQDKEGDGGEVLQAQGERHKGDAHNEGDELADVCLSDGKSELFIATSRARRSDSRKPT